MAVSELPIKTDVFLFHSPRVLPGDSLLTKESVDSGSKMEYKKIKRRLGPMLQMKVAQEQRLKFC